MLMVICLGVFGFSAYQLWNIFFASQEVKNETKEYEEVVVKDNAFRPDWPALQAQNEDIIAWIYIPGCDISYPVVQGDDNDYYLDHTAQGNFNRRGAIFLDANASRDFSDDHSIVYGHSVDVGGMFTDLAKYNEASFFEDNLVFYIFTPQGNYQCDVFLYSKTIDGSDVYTTSFGDFKEDVISKMKSQALYMNDQEVDGPMISLSTCDLDYGFNSNQRLVLTAIMHPTDASIEIE